VRVGDAPIRFRWVPPGRARDGVLAPEAARTWLDALYDEDLDLRRADLPPAREAEIPRGLWVAETELTRAQRAAIEGLPAPPPEDALRPEADLGFEAAQALARRLCERVGRGLDARLPTALEWAHAARPVDASGAGTTGAGATATAEWPHDALVEPGLAPARLDAARVGKTVSSARAIREEVPGLPMAEGYDPAPGTLPAGSLAPSARGLFDLRGNVAEWCLDREGDRAVLKGGAWNCAPWTACTGARFLAPLAPPRAGPVFATNEHGELAEVGGPFGLPWPASGLRLVAGAAPTFGPPAPFPPPPTPGESPRDPAARPAAPPLAGERFTLDVGHMGPALAVALSRDGRIAASGGDDGSIALWDVASGRLLRRAEVHQQPVLGLVISEDGAQVLSVVEDGAGLLDARTGAVTKLGEFTDGSIVAHLGAALSSDGRVLLQRGTAPQSDLLVVHVLTGGGWRMALQRREPGDTLEEVARGRVELAVAPDGRRILLPDWRFQPWVGDTPPVPAYVLREVEAPLDAPPLATFTALTAPAVPSSEGRPAPMRPVAAALAEAAGSAAEARRWRVYRYQLSLEALEREAEEEADAAKAAEARALRAAWSGFETWAVTTADGRLRASIDAQGRPVILDAATGAVARALGAAITRPLRVAFLPASGRLLVTGDDDVARVVDVPTARVVSSAPCAAGPFALDPEGRRFTARETPTWTARLVVRDLATGAVSAALEGSGPRDQGPAFSPDGRRIATAAGVYDAESGRRIAAFEEPPEEERASRSGLGGSIDAVGALPDGSAVIDDDRLSQALSLRVPARPAAGGPAPEPIELVHDEDVGASAMHSSFYQNFGLPYARYDLAPDGRRLLAGHGDGGVRIWDLALAAPGARLQPRVGLGKHGRQEAVGGPAPAVRFARSGRTCISGGDDGVVKVWDAATAARITSVRTHERGVLSVDLSPDGALLAAAGVDGTVAIAHVPSGEVVYRMAMTTSGDWVAFAEDGTYTTSRGGASLVSFVRDGRAFPFDAFDLRNNRPDRIWRRAGARDALVKASEAAWRKRLRRLGYREEDLSPTVALPEAAIDRATAPAVTSAATIALGFRARGGGAPVDRVHVLVNGVPLHGRKGLAWAAPAGVTQTGVVPVPLGHGRNEVRLSVRTAAGVESIAETVVVERTGPAPSRRLFVLAIGVSAYKDARMGLRYAAKDARDLAAALTAEGSGFAEAKALVLADGDAVREKILAARAFLAGAGVEDTVVLFAAGHGLLDERLDYVFACADVDFAAPSARGLAYDDLEGLLDGLPARRRLLLLDTCHGGEVDKDDVAPMLAQAPAVPGLTARGFGTALARSRTAAGEEGMTELLRSLFVDLRRGTGAVAIASAAGVEFALESDRWRNGAFTCAVIEALQDPSADADGSGGVSAGELRARAERRVRELTGGRQTPTARAENISLDFDVRRTGR